MLGLRESGMAVALAAALALPAAGAAKAQDALVDVPMVVFGPPSLGAFLPPIIKAQKIDEKHGLNIEFSERPPDAYSVQFNSGQFELGGSASLLTLAIGAERGVDLTYLFNVFDYWSAVVTSRDDVQSLKDLEGKDLAAARGTTTYKMFDWFARQQGVDLSNVSVVNTAAPGLIGYALADRAAAVHVWDPGYTTLQLQKPEIRTLDLKIKETWQAYAGREAIPYLGVAAHTSWVKENAETVEKLYATYKDAAAWAQDNPDEAAKLIMAESEPDVQAAVADLIRENDRLGLGVTWAAEQESELTSVLKMGTEIDVIEAVPGNLEFYGPDAK